MIGCLRVMKRRSPLVLGIGLWASACAVTWPAQTTAAPATLPAPPLPRTAAVSACVAPDGWTTFSNDELGFAVAYPPAGRLAAGEGEMLATVNFPADPATNVVEEIIKLSGGSRTGTCSSPLAEAWAYDELTPEAVVLNGIVFLRQSHSGVAAGTSSIWVAYTTEREARCVSLGYELRTFDPANLDPTRFPTPPAAVARRERVHDFEAVVATFTWLW